MISCLNCQMIQASSFLAVFYPILAGNGFAAYRRVCAAPMPIKLCSIVKGITILVTSNHGRQIFDFSIARQLQRSSYLFRVPKPTSCA
jgi:hypothetical protein